MKFHVSSSDKAFLYRLLKDALATVRPNRKSRAEAMRLITKLTPGDDSLFLREPERRVMLSWLYRFYDAADKRKEDIFHAGVKGGDFLLKLGRVIKALEKTTHAAS